MEGTNNLQGSNFTTFLMKSLTTSPKSRHSLTTFLTTFPYYDIPQIAYDIPLTESQVGSSEVVFSVHVVTIHLHVYYHTYTH
jgi:hypothetical protein